MNVIKWILSIVVALVVIGVAIVLLGGTKFLQIKKMIDAGEGGGGMQATAVSFGEARQDRWEVAIDAIGSVTAVEGVMIRAEVAGVVEAITFTAGAEAEAGSLLVKLDHSIEQANLEQALADLDLAERTLRRNTDLFATRSVPEANLDAAKSQLAAAKARVASLEASLAKKTLRAPFSGRLGIRQISVGQYLTPGDPVVLLQSMDPVYVEFSLPQRELGRLTEGLEVRAHADAFPDTAFTGTLTAINPGIDPATRNVRLQATFENPAHELRPGMFVEVEVIMPEARTVTMIPASAVLYAPYGNRVYVVKEADDGFIAQQAIVRLGEARGDFVEILDGLEGNERIVVDGAFKLNEGSPVFSSDQGTVEPELDPTPANS